MKKILTACIVLVSFGSKGQTYYCPLGSTNGLTKKIDQWFTVQDSTISIKTIANGKTDSISFKKMMSANPSVVYFKNGKATSSLTIIHSTGTMKGVKYTDVVSLKKDLKDETIDLCYCTNRR